MKEVWKDVAEFPDRYQVSNLGRVYGKKSKVYIKFGKNVKGYLCVNGQKENGRSFKRFAHRLVAIAFIDNPNNKPFVNHIDGNKENNSVDNLEWCTAKENSTHAVETGLYKRGEDCGKRSKLTNEDVHFIRKHYKKGCFTYGVKPLARLFGVSPSTVSCVVKRRNWTHI